MVHYCLGILTRTGLVVREAHANLGNNRADGENFTGTAHGDVMRPRDQNGTEKGFVFWQNDVKLPS